MGKRRFYARAVLCTAFERYYLSKTGGNKQNEKSQLMLIDQARPYKKNISSEKEAAQALNRIA